MGSDPPRAIILKKVSVIDVFNRSHVLLAPSCSTFDHFPGGLKMLGFQYTAAFHLFASISRSGLFLTPSFAQTRLSRCLTRRTYDRFERLPASLAFHGMTTSVSAVDESDFIAVLTS